MTEKHLKRLCQPRIEHNVGDLEPCWSCSARGKMLTGFPGAWHGAWLQPLPALALVSLCSGPSFLEWGRDGLSPVPSGRGWSRWVQGRMQMRLACLCKPSAAQSCLVLHSTAAACSEPGAAAAGFCERRKLPAWCRGIYRASQPCISIARVAGSLEISLSGSVCPSPGSPQPWQGDTSMRLFVTGT